jgi:uncharacterized protein with GYD domain
MPMYMIEASYTAEGLKGLMKDKASGRIKAVTEALAGLGGKIHSAFFTFGQHDVIIIAEVPDNSTAAGLSVAVSATGLVRIKTTPLLTVEEMDRALQTAVKYRGPGQPNRPRTS